MIQWEIRVSIGNNARNALLSTSERMLIIAGRIAAAMRPRRRWLPIPADGHPPPVTALFSRESFRMKAFTIAISTESAGSGSAGCSVLRREPSTGTSKGPLF